MILATKNFTFKIGNSRLVENNFQEKLSHDLWKCNNLRKNW